MKRELSKVKDFNVENLYQSIDYLDKGNVNFHQFKGFMKKQGLGVSDDEAVAFYARFGIFGEELKFTQKDFEGMVKPFDFSR